MNKLLIISAFTIFTATFLLSCASKKDASTSAPTTVDSLGIAQLSDDSLMLSFEKTMCYGTCPAYIYKIYNQGFVTYEGRAHVKNVGKFSSKLGIGRVNEIRELATSIGFFKYNDTYENLGISDLPSSIITVKTAKKIKKIKIQGGFSDMPDELKNFERFLDQMSTELKYTPLK